jgi:hypothetical protein
MTPNITKLSIASIVGVIGMKLDHSDIMDMGICFFLDSDTVSIEYN